MWRTSCLGVTLLFVAGPLVADDAEPDVPPLVSVIYKKNLKKHGELIRTTASLFDELPVEFKMGSEKLASESSGLVVYVTGLEIVGEQRFDDFISTTRLNGMPISAQPIVAGWKNLAVGVDYTVIMPVDKGRPKKVSSRAVGIAQGKGGTSFDVKLNNNENSLLLLAFQNATQQWRYGILQAVVRSETPSPDLYYTIKYRLKDGDGPYVFQATRATPQDGKLVAEFDLNNEFPFDIEVSATFFVLTKSTIGRSPSYYRVELDAGQRRKGGQTWQVESKSKSTQKVEGDLPYGVENGQRTVVGVFATLSVPQFRPTATVDKAD